MLHDASARRDRANRGACARRSSGRRYPPRALRIGAVVTLVAALMLVTTVARAGPATACRRRPPSCARRTRSPERLEHASPEMQPSPTYPALVGYLSRCTLPRRARARRRIWSADSVSGRPSVCRRPAIVDSGLLRDERGHGACAPAARSAKTYPAVLLLEGVPPHSSARGPSSPHGSASTVRGARRAARRRRCQRLAAAARGIGTLDDVTGLPCL